jgi:hypothetical protein
MIEPIVAGPANATAPSNPVGPEGVPFDSVLAALAGSTADLSTVVTGRDEHGGRRGDGQGQDSEWPGQAFGMSTVADDIAAARLGVMALVVESRPLTMPDVPAPMASVTQAESVATLGTPPGTDDMLDLSTDDDVVDLSETPTPSSPAMGDQAGVAQVAVTELPTSQAPILEPTADTDMSEPGGTRAATTAVTDEAELDLAEAVSPPGAGASSDPIPSTTAANHPAPPVAVTADDQSTNDEQTDEPEAQPSVSSEVGAQRPESFAQHAGVVAAEAAASQVELVGPGTPPARPVSAPPSRTPAETPSRIAMTNFSQEGRQTGRALEDAVDRPNGEQATRSVQAARGEQAQPIEVRPPVAPRTALLGDDQLRPAATRMAERIETWIKATANTPPPRSITLRGAELHGLTIRVSVHADGVSIQLEGARGDDVPWMRHVVDRLQERGIDVNEFNEYDGDGKRRPLWDEEEAQERRRRRPQFDPVLGEYTA